MIILTYLDVLSFLFILSNVKILSSKSYERFLMAVIMTLYCVYKCRLICRLVHFTIFLLLSTQHSLCCKIQQFTKRALGIINSHWHDTVVLSGYLLSFLLAFFSTYSELFNKRQHSFVGKIWQNIPERLYEVNFV